jgi:hypothetical protein
MVIVPASPPLGKYPENDLVIPSQQGMPAVYLMDGIQKPMVVELIIIQARPS